MLAERVVRKQNQVTADIWLASPSGSQFPAFRARSDRAPLASLIILLALLSINGCPLYNPAAFIKNEPTTGGQLQAGPNDVQSTAAQATLQWDSPPSGPLQVVSYIVSYRVHGTSNWKMLATVPASSQPEYTVLRSAVGNGSFDFAVAAVDSTGASSPLHTSLDPTADPASGWYLTWGP